MQIDEFRITAAVAAAATAAASAAAVTMNQLQTTWLYITVKMILKNFLIIKNNIWIDKFQFAAVAAAATAAPAAATAATIARNCFQFTKLHITVKIL